MHRHVPGKQKRGLLDDVEDIHARRKDKKKAKKDEPDDELDLDFW